MKVSAIIAAGGEGKRMGQPKQFLPLLGRPMIAYSLDAFNHCELVHEIILVINPEDLSRAEKLVKEIGIIKEIKIAIGGRERQDSVYHGLNRVSKEAEIVVIHDGCRPLVTKRLIVDVISQAEVSGAVVPAVPVKDTIKEVGEDKIVIATLDRSKLWQVQTPQAFKKNLIKSAFDHVQRLGEPVTVISGAYDNLKVTTPEDIIIAEAFLRNRRES